MTNQELSAVKNLYWNVREDVELNGSTHEHLIESLLEVAEILFESGEMTEKELTREQLALEAITFDHS